MSIEQIVLVDLNSDIVDAWSNEFCHYPSVRVECGSIFNVDANTLISPANSFGNMDGGLDGKLRDFFGRDVETIVRERIACQFFGELPVGLATIVETGHLQFPYLVCAPTMRYPADVSLSVNAYLAMKAILGVVQAHHKPLRLAVPGLCSLSGRMPAVQVARQMRIAYERVIKNMYTYTHWREEREFEKYIRGEQREPPEDLESRPWS
ncbi:MAG: macro domain-containing protein [Gammaproteobacteria bacterium]|nr:macro domain-containing protein [Gammaproteobacteria bacterium]MDH5652040.1 macro domain-containing protein [Gammaproteobacteria bacterium]